MSRDYCRRKFQYYKSLSLNLKTFPWIQKFTPSSFTDPSNARSSSVSRANSEEPSSLSAGAVTGGFGSAGPPDLIQVILFFLDQISHNSSLFFNNRRIAKLKRCLDSSQCTPIQRIDAIQCTMSKRDYKNRINRLIPLRSRLLWAFFDATHKISQNRSPPPLIGLNGF